MSGKLRLTCPVGFGNRVVVPAINRFLDRYPGIEVDLDLSDTPRNLTGEGFDLAIRIGELDSSNLIARPLAKVALLLVAAPHYLDRYGMPEKVDDLASHRWVLSSHTPRRLSYDYEGERYIIDTCGRVTVNDESARTSLVCQGQGIGLMPAYEAFEAMAQGKLVPLLERYPIPASPITALYHDRRFLPQKATTFVDYFTHYLSERNWLAFPPYGK